MIAKIATRLWELPGDLSPTCGLTNSLPDSCLVIKLQQIQDSPFEFVFCITCTLYNLAQGPITEFSARTLGDLA